MRIALIRTLLERQEKALLFSKKAKFIRLIVYALSDFQVNIESNGWNLKKTHLKATKRVEMMFYMLSLCYYISVVFGHICIALKESKEKKHGYVSITLFLKGRRFVDELFITQVSELIYQPVIKEFFHTTHELALCCYIKRIIY